MAVPNDERDELTNLNLTKLIDDAFDAIEEALGVKPKQTTEEPVNEVPERFRPEAPAEEPTDTCGDCPLDEDDEFAFLFFGGDEVDPAWEAIETLREAETATDNGELEKAALYVAIADRYINLADIFKETEITFEEETTVNL